MKLSTEVPVHELDLFVQPRIQRSVTQTLETKHRPLTTIGDFKKGTDVAFHINLAEDEYLLLQETFIHINCQLESGGKLLEVPVASAADVYPANYMLHTMIDSVKIKIGANAAGIEINNYPYKTYFEALLGYSDAAKATHLRNALWLDDDKLRGKEILREEDTVAKTMKAQPFELTGRLHYDFTHQGKAILGGCKVEIIISFMDLKFFLNTGSVKSVQLKLNEIYLRAKRYKVAPATVAAHKKALLHTPAKYPVSTARIFSQAISQKSLYVALDNFINDTIPNRLFIAFVKKTDFAGNKTSDPFMFSHYNVGNLALLMFRLQALGFC